ncbi:hypothetical protein FBU30_008594 [Linnemannia zychae]|nr:hypothetical protein FBU30_008594 [Linnemannia zychae]
MSFASPFAFNIGLPRSKHRVLRSKAGNQLGAPQTELSSSGGYITLHSIVIDETHQLTLDEIPLYTENGPLELYLKLTNRAGQRELIQLNDDNTCSELSKAWHHFRKLLNKQGKEDDQVVLDIFTYMNTPAPNNTTLNRGFQVTIRKHADSIGRAIERGRIQPMGRYESIWSTQTLSRRKADIQDERTPEIPESNTRSQVRHIDRLIDEGRIPASLDPFDNGPITLPVTSITFASREELQRAIGLIPSSSLRRLQDSQ